MDLDSTVSNMAIMKISAYHKSIGDEVHWYLPLDTYDKLYISKIFDYSVIPDYPNTTGAIIGGTGYDMNIKLPKEIDDMKLDYSIYPNNDYDIGKLSIGCSRQCAFCVVPKIEGKLKFISNVWSVYTGKHKRMMLLDNNFTALPDRIKLLEEIIDFQKKTKCKITFKQGLDIRTFRDDFAELLNKVKYDGKIIFSFDGLQYHDHVIKGIEIALKYIKPYRLMSYVLIGFDSTEKEDLYRIEKLRSYGIDPYVMPYNKKDPYQKRLARWVNHKAIFKSVKWNDYI